MADVSVARVWPTWAVPVMVGAPVAGVLPPGAPRLTATFFPSDKSSPGSFHRNWMREFASCTDASVEANTAVPTTRTNPAVSFGVTVRIRLPSRSPRALTVSDDREPRMLSPGVARNVV